MMELNLKTRLAGSSKAAQMLALAIVLLCYTVHINAATLSSTVDRNRISQNETFTLTVAYDQQVSTSDLDISGLQQDFEVISVRPQSSSSVSSVNGQTTLLASTIWVITLAPKREGLLSIPSFKIKTEETQAINIDVGSRSGSNNPTAPLAVDVVVDRDLIFPGQQFLVTIEIQAQSDVGDLNGPQLIIAGADVESLGQQNYQRVENGIAIQLVSLKFAVFAQSAGELVIPIMTFSGVKGGRRSIFSNRGQQIVARSEQLKINVQNIPLSNKSWFPAEQVTIQSAWATNLAATNKIEARVGDPITRTITITAQGQRAAGIAPLSHQDTDTYKSYRDQAVLDQQLNVDGIVSTRTESEAIVPANQGELVLPELSLSWFNVNTSQWQVATLPQEVIVVKPAIVGQGLIQSVSAGDDQPKISLDNEAGKQAKLWSLASLRLWQGLCLLFALIVLWQIFVIRKLNKSVGLDNNSSANLASPAQAQSWVALQKELKGRQAQAIKAAMFEWVKSLAPEHSVTSIRSLIEGIEDVEHQQYALSQVDALDAHLYSKGELDVDGLKKALSYIKDSMDNKMKERREELPPLYTKQA